MVQIDIHKRQRRIGDMEPGLSLSVGSSSDGDIFVSIGTGRGFPITEGDNVAFVQFCTRQGGGRSPKTLEALRNLQQAIAEDNAAFPPLNPDTKLTPNHCLK